jgi:hypothetical protein
LADKATTFAIMFAICVFVHRDNPVKKFGIFLDEHKTLGQHMPIAYLFKGGFKRWHFSTPRFHLFGESVPEALQCSKCGCVGSVWVTRNQPQNGGILKRHYTECKFTFILTLPTGTFPFGQWDVLAHHQVPNSPEWLVEECQLPDPATVADLSELQETGRKRKETGRKHKHAAQ